MSKYYVKITIGDFHYESFDADAESLKSLYRVGRMLIRYGKRYGVKTRFIVRDLETAETLLWMFSRRSKDNQWIARLSSAGKYCRRHPGVAF